MISIQIRPHRLLCDRNLELKISLLNSRSVKKALHIYFYIVINDRKTMYKISSNKIRLK